MTNDYTALVAMLDQAAADLQAEIDAAIDRHGLLVRTANQLRAEADGPSVAAEPVAILSVHERCTQEQRDALKQRLASDNRWQYVIDPANNTGRWTIQLDGSAQTIYPPEPPTIHADLPLPAQLIAARLDATTAQDERDMLRAREVAWQLRTMAAEAEVARLKSLTAEVAR